MYLQVSGNIRDILVKEQKFRHGRLWIGDSVDEYCEKREHPSVQSQTT
jgi:hypothetical protein